MAIPLIDDLIAWLYRCLGRIGSVLAAAGLLLCAVMVGLWFSTRELPHWSALELGVPLPHTSIGALDTLLTYLWTAKLGIPLLLLAVGMSLHLICRRWMRQMAEAEADLYASPAQADPAPPLASTATFRRRTSC